MEQFILKLKDDSKRNFFLELLGQLDFVEVVKEIKDSNKAIFAKELADAFEDIKLHQEGKKKLKSAKDLLDEL